MLSRRFGSLSVSLSRAYAQVNEWRRLLQIHLQATESQRDFHVNDPFDALKQGELCADSIAHTLAPNLKHRVRRAWNRTVF